MSGRQSVGRSKAEMYQDILDIGVDGMIGGNGAYIEDHDTVVFHELKAGTWGGAGEKALFGDLGVKDITKAFAINKLCDYLGWDPKDTIAFGDAKVDIPMFEACGASCCMGSGGPEAKAAADYVTTDVDKDGLANAFRHFGLV